MAEEPCDVPLVATANSGGSPKCVSAPTAFGAGLMRYTVYLPCLTDPGHLTDDRDKDKAGAIGQTASRQPHVTTGDAALGLLA